MPQKSREKGKITVFSDDVSAGIIMGDDGRTYLFSRKDWASPEKPQDNLDILFTPDNNRARDVKTKEDE